MKELSEKLIKLYLDGKSDSFHNGTESINNPVAFFMPSSAYFSRRDRDDLLEDLMQYDVISFDIFDTLILRKVAHPTDVFTLMENKMKETFFKDMRILAESNSREKYAHSEKEKKNGVYGKNLEVNIDDIYDELENLMTIDKKKAKNLEFETEKEVCYANPYIQYIFNKLVESGKKVIIVSDIYWSLSYIEKLLSLCGYKGYEKIYLSCEYLCNKGTGKLQELVSKDYKDKAIIHIGDNYSSDVLGTRKNSWHAYHYAKCGDLDKNLTPALPKSLSSSVYYALMESYLHADEKIYTKEYEHGFRCAGPIVYGFNKWIHEYKEKNNIDKILFLARDMDIFCKAYSKMYPEEKNTYTAISRSSMWILCFEDYTEAFIRYFFLTRAKLGKQTFEDALIGTDMAFLVNKLQEVDIKPDDVITNENYQTFHDFLMKHKKEIIDHYKPSVEAAKTYFSKEVGNAKKIVAIDLGWRGSIVMMMESVFRKLFGDALEVKGAFVGLTDNESSNQCIERGLFDAYLFTAFKNSGSSFSTRTLEGDMCAKFFEATFTSDEGTLLKYILEKDGKPAFMRGIKNNDEENISEMQSGVMDFVREYSATLNSLSGNNLLLEPLENLKIGMFYLSNPGYCYKLFKEVKEWEFALPNFKGEGTLTTLGKMLIDRNLL